MGKLLVRVLTIVVAIYLLIAFYIAQMYGEDILTGSHTLLYELIVVVYAHSEGKYHCRYLKFTISGIFIAECITHLDYSLNFLTTREHNWIPFCCIAIGIGCSMCKALMHFYKVVNLKQKKKNYGGGFNSKAN